MARLTLQMRQDVAQLALATLADLGRQDLISTLHIEWKGSFTSRGGDALYMWSDACGPDFPEHAHRLLEKPQYKNALSSDGSILRAVRMRFSAPLWPRATEKERHDTVVHETCHLVAAHEAMLDSKIYIQSHGPEWILTMLRAGVNPKRCHNIDTSGLGQKKVPCVCECGDHFMTPLKAGRILIGNGYSCRVCKQNILVDMSRITGKQVKECMETAIRHPRRRRRTA